MWLDVNRGKKNDGSTTFAALQLWPKYSASRRMGKKKKNFYYGFDG